MQPRQNKRRRYARKNRFKSTEEVGVKVEEVQRKMEKKINAADTDIEGNKVISDANFLFLHLKNIDFARM